MSNFEVNISSILQKLIHKKGLSISELARRTNIPQPTIYRIAYGEHQRPHQKTLQALSNFFNLTIDQLIGLEPIEKSVLSKPSILQIPILNLEQIANWPQKKNVGNTSHVIYEKPISDNGFALKMPDKSMEPLITRDALLIIDPDKKPEYRSLVVVKLYNFNEVVVRQLIKDAGNCYIRPLNQDFDQFEMVLLGSKDFIKGTVVEARLNCEEL